MVSFKSTLMVGGILIAAACANSAYTGGAGMGAPWDKPDPRAEQGQAYSDFLIARFAAMTNDPRTAATRYASALESAPSEAGIAERAVFASLLSGEFSNAVDLAETAGDAERRASLVRLTLAVDAIRRGDGDAALAQLEEGRFGPFNRMVARNMSAWQILDDHGESAALNHLKAALTGDPNLDSATLYMMGLIQVSAHSDADALETFDLLWESGARLAVGVEAHARLLTSTGQHDRAVSLLTEFREQVGQNAALDQLAEHIRTGKRVRLKRLSIREGAALAIYVPAAALMAQTDDDLSGVYFVLALALDQDLHVARSLWAQALDNAGRRTEAIAILEAIPRTSPFYATSRGQMAWALRREERNDEALTVAAQALERGDDRDLRIQLADLYRSLDRQGEADQLLTDIIEADMRDGRSDWRLLFARGTAREQLGRWPEAEADLKAALVLQPENASLLNYLGYSWVDRGLNLDQAFNMIRRAVELRPDSGQIIDSLGWAHYKRGQYDLAVRFLERAVALEPADPVLNDHLGDAYWQVGRKTEARFQWQRALKLGPEKGEVDTIEAKLSAGLGVPATALVDAGAVVPPSARVDAASQP
jgi:tetratricopeptide (TPR) repeat protein